MNNISCALSIYFIGSGDGQAVIAAALSFNFGHCVGIEALKSVWEFSLTMKARFELEFLFSPLAKQTQVDFLNVALLC